MSDILGTKTAIPTVAPGSKARSPIGLPGRANGSLLPETKIFPKSGHQALPSYLREVYDWAYLNPRNARLLDNEAVVNTILWGNSGRLRRAALAEITAGDRVIQVAHVYGRLIPELVRTIGPTGRFDVIEISRLQAALCRRKMWGFANARVRVGDAARLGAEKCNVALSFFLLHELPDPYKCAVVDAQLARLLPGGKAVFVDYHGPALWHPLRGLMSWINASLEPFAESMWRNQIEDFASDAGSYDWHTETYFGGLYQKTIARKRQVSEPWK